MIWRMADGRRLIARSRLARLVKDRRTEMELSVVRAAAMANIARNTWSAVEQGTRETEDYVYAAVERVLQWAPGTARRVLEGDPQRQPQTRQKPADPDSYKDTDLDRVAALMADPRVGEESKAMLRAQLRAWAGAAEDWIREGKWAV